MPEKPRVTQVTQVASACATPFVAAGFVAIAASDALSASARCAAHRLRRGKVFSNESRQSTKCVGQLEVDVFDPDGVDWTMLRVDYIDRCVPFVLRRCSGKISDVSPPANDAAAGAQGTIHVKTAPIAKRIPGIDELVHKLLPHTWRAYWPLWFLGNYKSGVAHIDMGPASVNFYFLRTGSKDVVIAPKHVSAGLKLKTGIDSIYIPGSAGNHDYLASLSSYYRVTLQEQDVLVFNNSGLLHHFSNVEGAAPCEALSVRCKYALGSDKRCRRLLASSPKVWQHMAGHFVGLLLSANGIKRVEERSSECQ